MKNREIVRPDANGAECRQRVYREPLVAVRHRNRLERGSGLPTVELVAAVPTYGPLSCPPVDTSAPPTSSRTASAMFARSPEHPGEEIVTSSVRRRSPGTDRSLHRAGGVVPSFDERHRSRAPATTDRHVPAMTLVGAALTRMDKSMTFRR
jgi:hypothetical protein